MQVQMRAYIGTVLCTVGKEGKGREGCMLFREEEVGLLEAGDASITSHRVRVQDLLQSTIASLYEHVYSVSPYLYPVASYLTGCIRDPLPPRMCPVSVKYFITIDISVNNPIPTLYDSASMIKMGIDREYY